MPSFFNYDLCADYFMSVIVHPYLPSGASAQAAQKKRLHAAARRNAIENAQRHGAYPPPVITYGRRHGQELDDARKHPSLPAAIDPMDNSPWPKLFGRHASAHKSDGDAHPQVDIFGNRCAVVETRGAALTDAIAATSTAHPAAILLSKPDALDEWLVGRHAMRHCKAGASTLTARQQLMEANSNQWRTVAPPPGDGDGAQQSIRAVPPPPSPRVLELAKSRSVRLPVARGEAAVWSYGALGGGLDRR